MDEPVKYTDAQHSTIVVADRGDYGCVVIVSDDDGPERHVHVKGDFRRHTARALAGDDCRVISADAHDRLCERAEQPDRPEPVDPASVRVGQVVEIEADDGSWMVRGRVDDVDNTVGDSYLPICIQHPNGEVIWIDARESGATVRVLHRAEPEPDEAVVTALADALVGVGVTSAGPDALGYARALIRHRNVRVVNRDE